ncbi:SDR family oxidoreductase [Pseudonocardiaceae bacterium YIM PH 21723]|nr:SDR family oxidoreductase [Pseudonocardiaceae bacterium YIM PH 21723]
MAALDGRVALVTGGARGIGAATARRLAADGATIAVLDLSQEQAAVTAAEIGGKSIAVAADVSNEDQVEAAVGKVVAELGQIDILVNNAGVLRDNLLYKMSASDWDTVLNVHVRGAFLCSRAASRSMVERKTGAIINLSSTSALGNRGQANYSTAKAGLQGLTRTLAIELGRYGIRVNAVAPGFIATDMTAATAARVGVDFEQFQAASVAAIPIGRVGQPEDIANVISFLAGPDSAFVTGQTLYVDGGMKL